MAPEEGFESFGGGKREGKGGGVAILLKLFANLTPLCFVFALELGSFQLGVENNLLADRETEVVACSNLLELLVVWLDFFFFLNRGSAAERAYRTGS